jgi:CRP-like cAMP-binding protein
VCRLQRPADDRLKPVGTLSSTACTCVPSISSGTIRASGTSIAYETTGGGRRKEREIQLPRATLREDDIAAMVGTVRVHVSRSLKTLAAMGAITVDRNTICIKDLEALESFLHAAEPEA